MCDAILSLGLRSWQLVVALELHRRPRNGEDGVGAPLAWIGRATLRLHSSAPLVREQNLGSIIVEGRRVPVREIGIGRRVEANGMRRVAYVEQQSVTAAGAAGSAYRRVQRDVV